MEENRMELENEMIEVNDTEDYDGSEEITPEETTSEGGLETILAIGAIGAVVGVVTTKVVVPKVKSVGKKAVSKVVGFFKDRKKSEDTEAENDVVEGSAEEIHAEDPEEEEE